MVGSVCCSNWSKVLAVLQCSCRFSRVAQLAEHLERRDRCHQRLCGVWSFREGMDVAANPTYILEARGVGYRIAGPEVGNGSRPGPRVHRPFEPHLPFQQTAGAGRAAHPLTRRLAALARAGPQAGGEGIRYPNCPQYRAGMVQDLVAAGRSRRRPARRALGIATDALLCSCRTDRGRYGPPLCRARTDWIS